MSSSAAAGTSLNGAGLHGAEIRMYFGGNRALDGVDIDVRPGDWLGLIGPNGSGKTTLLNILSGVYIATSGEVSLDDRAMTGRRPGHFSRSGIVRTFQHPQLARSLTIWENLRLGTDLRRDSGQRRGKRETDSDLLDLVEMFGCMEFAHHLPEQAPYGVRKLAEIVRAAAVRPAVLLLDEPAAGLSAEERHELVQSLTLLREAFPEMGVCLVEHDIRLVASICPTIQVLNFGQVLAKGPAASVLRHDAVVAAYLGSSATSLNLKDVV